MALLFAGGPDFNLLGRASSVAMLPAADALFPAARLYDAVPSDIAKFQAGADPKVTVDLALYDPGMGAWVAGTPTGWTETNSGGGTVVETTVGGEVRSGSASKHNKSAGVAQLHRDVIVRAGEQLIFDAWVRIGGAGRARIQIQNLDTLKYLTSANVWQTAQAWTVDDNTNTSYTQYTRTFTAEAWSVVQAPTVTLRITLDDGGTGGGSDFAFFDDVAVWPQWNFVSIHGHNIAPLMVVEARSSTDNFSGSNVLEATMAMRKRSFYKTFTASTKRYFRLAMTGTQPAARGPAYIGELVVAYIETSLRKQEFGWELREVEDQAVNRTPRGEAFVAIMAQEPRRAVNFSKADRVTPAFEQWRDEVYRRTRGAAYPLVIVPYDVEDAVIHGRIDSTWAVQRKLNQRYDSDITVLESPFPSVVS